MFNINLSKISISDLKKYTSIIIFLVAALFIAGGYFLWAPKYNEFKSNNVRLNAEAEVVKSKKNYLIELEGNLSNLNEYENAISKIGSALPLEASADSLFSFTQRVASENGLIIVQADLKEGSGSTVATLDQQGLVIYSLGVSLTLKGSYSSFKDFISAIYKSSRMVEISAIRFNHKNEKEERLDVFEFNVDLKVNYYKKIDSQLIIQ